MASSTELATAIDALSPIAYWKFNETSGTSSTRLGSSTAGNMALSGSYTIGSRELIIGDADRFVTLTGGYARATLGDIATPLVGSCSVSFLIDFISVSSGDSYLFTVGGSGETLATNHIFNLILTSSTYALSINHETGAGVNSDCQFNQPLLYPSGTGGKCLITVTRDNTLNIYKLYVNGIFRAVSSFTNDPSGGTSSTINIGVDPGTTLTPPSFAVGHFCFFDKVLTAAEIAGLGTASGYLDTVQQPTVANTSYINVVPDKRLQISSDPLVDPTLNSPETAFSES